MIYIYSFLFAGFVCLIGQLILDNTKLTPGHITSLFVIIGAALDIFKESGLQKGSEIIKFIKEGEVASDNVVSVLDNLLKEKMTERKNEHK